MIKLRNETYKLLSIKPPTKKQQLITFVFNPEKGSGRVSVKKLPGKHNNKFKWVAEIRPDKSQAIAQKVLTNASRMGLYEFEFLRRKASRL